MNRRLIAVFNLGKQLFENREPASFLCLLHALVLEETSKDCGTQAQVK